MMRAISLLLVLCFLALPVSAIGVINPSTESQPIWCQFYYTKWICGTGTSGTGGIGPQGIPGINGTVGEGDINYFNFTGSNLTTISNITNFFTYSEMNQTANMTAGPQGIEGPMGPANMTAGPQGSPGEIPDSSQFYFLNGTRTLTGNMNAGSKQIASLITGATGDTATNKTYVDAVNISMKNYADAQNATAITDHGALTGLTDDDHVRYFDKDTSKALTGRDLGRNVDNSYIVIRGGTTNANSGYVVLYGYNAGSAYNGGFGFAVTNAAHTATTELMAGRGNIDAPYLNMLSHAISNVLDPLSAQDAATRNYVLHPDYTASAQSNAVCYNTGTKLVTYNSGATTCLASSEKTKKNIIQLSEDFSTRLMQLKPIYYTSEIDGQNHYGLLAEDVTKVFPELVARDEGGNLSGVRYEEFTGVLLKGYQEQQVKLNNICTNNPKLCEV